MHVVGSNDRNKIEDAKEELDKMMNEDEMRDWAVVGSPAVKQEQFNPVAVTEVTEKLGLYNLRYNSPFVLTRTTECSRVWTGPRTILS